MGKTEEFHAAYESAVDKIRTGFGQKHPMIIDGQETWATSTFDDLCPADTKVDLGLFQKGTRAHAKRAVKAAKTAFPSWAAKPYTERVRLVQRAADLISQLKFELAALMSFENGKNRYEAMADVDEAADLMRWYAAEMLRNQGYERPMGQFLPGETTRSILKPYGVWAIVAASADLDKAALGVVRAAFGYGGQKCSACSRVLVERRVKDAFLAKLIAETEKLKVGDPTVRDVYLGPVINEAAVATYQKAIAEIKSSNGKILTGGRAHASDGHFVEPTIVDGLPRDHRINKEELFVPILSIVEVDDLTDAIRVANDVDYGLTAGIFSREPSELHRFFAEVEAGVVYANRAAGSTTGAVVGVQPFGGWKMSGISGKAAGGHYYLAQFLRERSESEYA